MSIQTKVWSAAAIRIGRTVTGHYHDLGIIAGATRYMAANTSETRRKAEDKQEILKAMGELLPHADVMEGLQLLKRAGFRLATLSHSPQSTFDQQSQNGGLSPFFEATLSVDGYQIYKAPTNTYKKALEKLNVAPAEALLVTAHGWDIAGDLASGMPAVFMERRGQALYPLAAQPQYRVQIC